MKAKGTRKKILIVDDESYIHELLSFLLSRDDAYEVLTANDGSKGWEIIEEDEPDLVFLDLMLPKLDGLEVCKRTKAGERTKQIPVVIMTASAKLREAAITEAGADHILAKPFNMMEILSLVEKLVRP